jgi:hypothetical protein
MTTKPPLQTFFKKFCTKKMKANKIMKRQAVQSHRKSKDKKVKNNSDSATHNQTLKQQKQLNDRNHHIPINANTEC